GGAVEAVEVRRRVVQLLGDKKAARVVFEEIAPRFVDRPGGYTRILKLATPRLGDAGPRALLEFVGQDSAAARPQRPKVDSARPVST
ncbi:MAG: bL17 family ribosomal protein, partial [Planctomycetota bacterium]